MINFSHHLERVFALMTASENGAKSQFLLFQSGEAGSSVSQMEQADRLSYEFFSCFCPVYQS